MTSEHNQPYIETPVKTIFKKFANAKDVSLVYGEPIEVGFKKVIPVAKAQYAIGGGGDGRGGEGGGGAFSVKPVGVYEITPDRTTFKSTIDMKKLTICTMIAAGIVGYFAFRRK